MAKGKIWASCKLVRDRQFTRTRLGKLYPVSCCTALASPLLPNIPVERPLVKFFSPHFFHILRKRQKWAQKPQAGISRRRLRKQAYLFFALTRAKRLLRRRRHILVPRASILLVKKKALGTRMATPPLVSPRQSAQIPYQWRVPTRIWVVLLIGFKASFQPTRSNT